MGLTLSYKVQPSPDGLAQAFILGAEFIGNDDVSRVLGPSTALRANGTRIRANGIKYHSERV